MHQDVQGFHLFRSFRSWRGKPSDKSSQLEVILETMPAEAEDTEPGLWPFHPYHYLYHEFLEKL
jgi:hypothetical protein